MGPCYTLPCDRRLVPLSIPKWPVVAPMAESKKAETSCAKQEYQVFKQKLPELLRTMEGNSSVLIHGSEVAGSWEDEDSAYTAWLPEIRYGAFPSHACGRTGGAGAILRRPAGFQCPSYAANLTSRARLLSQSPSLFTACGCLLYQPESDLNLAGRSSSLDRRPNARRLPCTFQPEQGCTPWPERGQNATSGNSRTSPTVCSLRGPQRRLERRPHSSLTR